MPTIRELVTRYVFKADGKAVDDFGRRIDRAKSKMDSFVDASGRLRASNGRFLGTGGGGGGAISAALFGTPNFQRGVDMMGGAVNSATRMAIRMAAAFTASGLGVGAFFKQAGDFEQTEVAFDTMLGSVERRQKVLAELQKFALATPFNFTQVAELSKRLLAFDFAADELIPTMTSLGNIAAGVGRDKLPQLVLALGQVRTATKLRGQELRQFTEAGVPLISELAKQLGVSEKAIQGMVEGGRIGFPVVQKALAALSQEGGRFHNLMQRQSKTLLGMASNLVDKLQMMVIRIGKRGLLKESKAYLQSIIDILDANDGRILAAVDQAVRLALKGMYGLIQVTSAAWRVFRGFAAFLGGTNNALNLLVTTLTLFAGAKMLIALGQFAQGMWEATRAILALEAGALGVPLAIGLALAAIALVAEDIYAYFQGRKSITGLILNSFDSIAAKASEAFDGLRDKLAGFAKEATKTLVSALLDIDPADLADKFKKALDGLLVAFGGFIELGRAIGGGIVEGIESALREKAPTLANFLFGELGPDGKAIGGGVAGYLSKLGTAAGDTYRDTGLKSLWESITSANYGIGAPGAPTLKPAPAAGGGVSIGQQSITVNVGAGASAAEIGAAVRREARDGVVDGAELRRTKRALEGAR